MVTPGDKARQTMKFEAKAHLARQVAQRLVEHYPVDDTFGTPPARPRTPEALIEYVEWALPLARKLGTRVSPAEARAIGFMHAAFKLKTAAAEEALAAQRAEATKTPEGLDETVSDRAVAEPDQALGTV